MTTGADVISAIQNLARGLEESATEFGALEEECAVRLRASTELEDLLHAAVGAAEARGARKAFESVAKAFFAVLAERNEAAA